MADKKDVSLQDELAAAQKRAEELILDEAVTQGAVTDDKDKSGQNDPAQGRKNRDILEKEAEESDKFRQEEKDKAAKKAADERKKAERENRASVGRSAGAAVSVNDQAKVTPVRGQGSSGDAKS